MKKRNETIRMLVLSAMFAALCCVTTMLVRFPTVAGYTNIGEGMCLLAGLVLGPWYGFFAAGIGSGLADLLAGYAHYVPGTFIIKGLVALVAMMPLIVVQVMGAIYVVKTGRAAAAADAQEGRKDPVLASGAHRAAVRGHHGRRVFRL